MHEYARASLEIIGSGSTRTAYVLNTRKALKVAVGDYTDPKTLDDPDAMARAVEAGEDFTGTAQNRREAEVFAGASDVVKPALAAVLDHDPEYRWIISELVRPLSSDEEMERLAEEAGPAWSEAVDELERTGMFMGDFGSHNCGKTADGRLVVLDYGMLDPGFEP